MERTVAVAALLAIVTAAVAAEPSDRPQPFLAIGRDHGPPPVFAAAEDAPGTPEGEPTTQPAEEPTGPPADEPKPLFENLWLLCPGARRRMLEEFERHSADPDAPRMVEAEEYVWGVRCVYRTRDDMRMHHLDSERLESPGPPLIGSFDQEMLYWMDFERLEEGDFAFGYRARRYFDADVSGQHGEMGFVRHDAFIRGDFSVEWPLSAYLKARTLDFHRRPRLPDEGGRFPDCLTDLQAGGTIPWILPLGILNITFGSASDKPFASGREMTWDVTWALGGLSGEDTFAFFVNWQTNRDFCNHIPLPGFVYRYRQGDWFTLLLGFPDSAIAWRPTEKFELAASYKFPRTVYSRVSYLPWPNLRLFAGFEWENLRFFRHDRHRSRDRLWYDEKRVLAGVRWNFSDAMYLEASAGYAFDRMWFEGETYHDRSFNRIDVADGPFAGVQMVLRF